MANRGGRWPGWEGLRTESGNVDRPLWADRWLSPGKSLSVADGHLVIDSSTWLSAQRPCKATAKMLVGFTGLSRTQRDPERAVLLYARTWGLLDLCEHLAPMNHDRRELPLSFGMASFSFQPMREFRPIPGFQQPREECRSLSGAEPISAWLYWSRQAAAILGVVTRLRAGDPMLASEVLTLTETAPWVDGEPQAVQLNELNSALRANALESLGHADLFQHYASEIIQMWLRLAGVSLELRWPLARPEVGFGGGQLLGAVGLGLVLAAVGATAWAICPSCGTIHAAESKGGRPPRYCIDCRGEKMPQRLAQSRYLTTDGGRNVSRVHARTTRANRNKKKKSALTGD
jgi:hypothetical protein